MREQGKNEKERERERREERERERERGVVIKMATLFPLFAF